MRRLRDLAGRHGRTVVVVLYEVSYAAHADRLVGLKASRVVLNGTPAEVLTGEVLSALFDTPVRVGRLTAPWSPCTTPERAPGVAGASGRGRPGARPVLRFWRPLVDCRAR